MKTQWASLLTAFVLPHAAAEPVASYADCLGDTLSSPSVAAVSGSAWVQSDPYCDFFRPYICYPNGTRDAHVSFRIWREQCRHDAAQFALLVQVSAPAFARFGLSFKPEHVFVEQEGVRYRDSLLLTKSPRTLANAEIRTSDPPTTLLLAQSGSARFDESRALTFGYDVPGSVDGPLVHSGPVRMAFADAEPMNYTGLWWNPAEPGWGLNLSHQGDTIFATLFTYDNDGEPMWLVMSSGKKLPGEETFEGDLFRTSGSALGAQATRPLSVARVGTMTIRFSGRTLSYSANGVVITKPIQPQVFDVVGQSWCRFMPAIAASGTLNGRTVTYQGLWWNAAEPGWGLNVVQQDDTYFGTLFTYEASGRELWLVMSAGRDNPRITTPRSIIGDLYRAYGPPFNAQPFTPAVRLTKVGVLTLFKNSVNELTMEACISGVCIRKPLTLQRFGSPEVRCLTR